MKRENVEDRHQLIGDASSLLSFLLAYFLKCNKYDNSRNNS